MEKIEVKIKAQKDSSYPILIGEGLLNEPYKYIKEYTNANKFLVVTNETVMPIYGNRLREEGVEFIVLPDGEMYKTMDTLNKILDKALELKLERRDCIIALGGRPKKMRLPGGSGDG